jgi:3-phosphoshikimate 1-carboxyvinyltransferase
VYPKAEVKQRNDSGTEFSFLLFSLVALSETASITLSSYKETSLQEIPLW